MTWRRRFARAGSTITLALASGCGARSSLPEALATVADAGSDPCAPPSVDAACAQAVAEAPSGSQLWKTSISTGAADLLGPVAADAAGDTFYLAADQALYVKTVFAVDACGAQRWSADVGALVAASGYVPQVMVAGGHVLLVGIGSIVALDVATGAHTWTADLAAFAQGGGLGVTPGKVVGMGFTAASADGRAFTVVANDLDAWIVSVSVQGKMHSVAKVANYLGGLGYPLGAQQLIIDAAGHVVLAGGSNPGAPDRINAFTATGKSVYDSVLPGWGNSRFLAAGPDFVTGEGLWLLDNADASPRNTFVGGGPTFVSFDGPFAIDAAGRVFAVGDQHLDPGSSAVTANLLGGFSPDGSQRWRVALDEPVESGPVLGDGGQLFVLTTASTGAGSPQHLSAFALEDGAPRWRVDLPPSGKLPSYWLLLSAAGTLQLVIDHTIYAFASGNARPPTCAWWPTPRGPIDQRACASGS